jgi:hypothetical protein
MSFELVTIRVGAPPVNISVYKDIICSVPYFNAAFNRGVREATEVAITLPDVSEPIFRIFVQWCHSQMRTSWSTAQAIVPDKFLDGTVKQANDEATDATDAAKFLDTIQSLKAELAEL